MKTFLLAGLLGLSLLLGGGGEPGDDGVITDALGTVQKVGRLGFGIVPDFDKGTRFQPLNMDASFQRDGLRVRFSGKVTDPDPHVRMWGTPLELTAIEILEE